MIAETVRRLLRLLKYKKHFIVRYEGKLPTWNTIYEGRHWTKRYSLQKEYEKLLTILLLEAKVKPVKEFVIVAFYNDNKDADNITVIIKWMVDVMKGKYVDNDDSRFYKGLSMFYDPTMKKKSIEIHILGQ